VSFNSGSEMLGDVYIGVDFHSSPKK